MQGSDRESELIEENLKSFEKYQRECADLRKTISDKEEFKRKVAELEKRYMGDWDYLSNWPFITIAEDLLKCLKEDLVEELVFGIASWTKRQQNLPFILNKLRIDKFNESFRKCSNKCFFINGDNKKIPSYWKRVVIVCSDFDVWILTLDPGNINEKAFELIYNNLGSDKVYVLSDYNCNKKIVLTKKDNVNLVKNEITDLKNEDFNNEDNKELNHNNIKMTFYSYSFITPIILFRIYYISKKLWSSKQR